MAIHRRLPLFARPLPFVLGMAAFVLGLLYGPSWYWDWSLQTGNIFVLILVPKELFVLDAQHALWLGVAVAGLIFLGFFGFTPRRNLPRTIPAGWRGLLAPRFRFYPLTLLLGLFLTFFGAMYFFDATMAADRAPGGFVTFVYLNYAGIVDRPVLSLIGLTLLTVGLLCSTFLAFSPGLGLPRAAPLRRVIVAPPPPVAPEPAAAAPTSPAPPTLVPAPRAPIVAHAPAPLAKAPTSAAPRARPARTGFSLGLKEPAKAANPPPAAPDATKPADAAGEKKPAVRRTVRRVEAEPSRPAGDRKPSHA